MRTAMSTQSKRKEAVEKAVRDGYVVSASWTTPGAVVRDYERECARAQVPYVELVMPSTPWGGIRILWEWSLQRPTTTQLMDAETYLNRHRHQWKWSPHWEVTLMRDRTEVKGIPTHALHHVLGALAEIFSLPIAV